MVRLLTVPILDWKVLAPDNRSLIKSLGYREHDPAAVLIALQKSKFPELSPSQAVRQPQNSFLRLLYLNFLADEPVSDFLMESGINYTSYDSITIMGGTLEDWRDGVISATQTKSSGESRRVAGEIFHAFQQIKL